MEEEIRNNKEAMDNVIKICCSIVEMLDYMSKTSSDKYSKNVYIFNQLNEYIVEMLLNIDSFVAMCVSGVISDIDLGLTVFNRTSILLNGYIQEEIYTDVPDLDIRNTLIDIIKAEINIIDIIASNKDKIKKHFNVVMENKCGPLLIIDDETTIFNPAFNATNENIYAVVNMYYFVQEVYDNEKHIQELLDRL